MVFYLFTFQLSVYTFLQCFCADQLVSLPTEDLVLLRVSFAFVALKDTGCMCLCVCVCVDLGMCISVKGMCLACLI